MTDLKEMSRVLYHHDWADVHDWARNIEQLADLSDDQIGQLPGSRSGVRSLPARATPWPACAAPCASDEPADPPAPDASSERSPSEPAVPPLLAARHFRSFCPLNGPLARLHPLQPRHISAKFLNQPAA